MCRARWQPSPLIVASMLLHVLAVLALLFQPESWQIVLSVLLANHVVLTAIGLWPRSHWLGPNLTQLPAASVARKEAALTIDDGPDPDVTPLVLDILDDYGVKATFFCIGEKAERYPELCREIVRRGHAVENHSQYHRHIFSLMGPIRLKAELQSAQDSLSAITGQRPIFFRAPAGIRNPFLDWVLVRLNLRLASWSVRGFDTCKTDITQVSANLMEGLRAGAILLLHDGNAARTREGVPVILMVLPKILAHAAAAKLHFVSLRQALA